MDVCSNRIGWKRISVHVTGKKKKAMADGAIKRRHHATAPLFGFILEKRQQGININTMTTYVALPWK